MINLTEIVVEEACFVVGGIQSYSSSLVLFLGDESVISSSFDSFFSI